MKLDVPVSEKTAACPWESRLCCDVYLTTERLKDRVNYLSGKISAGFIDGAVHCIDTFMQQLPADEDRRDWDKRRELIQQTTLFDEDTRHS